MRSIRVQLSCNCVLTLPACEWGQERYCLRHRTTATPVSLYAPPQKDSPPERTGTLF